MLLRPFPIILFVLFMSFSIDGFSASIKPRILTIAIDAIPYAVVKDLHDLHHGKKRLFADLKGPAAVITTFPSNSYTAWSGILQPYGVAKSLGYEARYFDIETAEVVGGLSLTKVPAPWKDFFDWKLDGVIRKAIAYGWPQKYAVTEMEDGMQAFLASDKQHYSMYIVSTDGVGHIQGPSAFAEFLQKLDTYLAAFKQAHPENPFYTLLISDHGMAGGKPLINIWPAVESTLTQAGFHVTEELHDKTDTAIISFGLLTSFVAYTWPGDEQKTAASLTSVTGVDICMTKASNGWNIHSLRGNALIKRRENEQGLFWSYEKKSGDPLNYQSLVDAMRIATAKGDENWFSDDMWFNYSKDHYYPDALYRLAHSLDIASNPTSITCSVSAGYMFGALKTEYIAIPTIGRLRWTHGALHRDASLGFMMTDLPNWSAPDYVRHNKALLPLRNLVQE